MEEFNRDQGQEIDAELAERLTFSIKAANIGCWEVDLKSNTVKWDGRCQELFGLSKDYYIPYDQAIKHIHPDDLAMVNTAVERSLAGENGGIYDARYRTIGANDGILRWVHFSGRTYFDDNNKPLRFGGIAQDITASQLILQGTQQSLDKYLDELVKQKEDYQESEARIRNIVEQSPVAIGILRGRNMVIELVNDAICTVWGKTRAVIGKEILDALPEIRDQKFMSLLQQVYDTGEPYFGTAALAVLERNGRLENGYFNFVYTPVRTNGVIPGVMVLANEVTELVIARKTIELSESKMKAIVKSAPAAIALFTGPDLVVEIPNQAFLDIAGRGREIEGLPLTRAMPELVDQVFIKILNEVYSTGRQYQAAGVKADIIQNGIPKLHYFNFSYTPLKNSDGEVYAILDITTDVTDEYLKKQQIEENAAFLKAAVDVAELATWSIDAATGELSYSDRLREWLGSETANGPLDNVFQFVDPDSRELVTDAVRTALTPGSDGILDVELTVSNPNTGLTKVLHSQGKTLYDEQGKPLKLVGTAQDITVHRQLQLALEEQIQLRTAELDALNEELQAANEELAATNEELSQSNEDLLNSNQDLQQFAHVTSHDLKEPLRKIKTFLSRVVTDADSQYSSKSKDFIASINKSVGRMQSMIDGILSYSRINGNAQTTGEVNINKLLSDVLTDLEILIAEKQATVNIDQLPVITGSQVLLHQLFYNLMTNSLKFAKLDQPSNITIRSERIIRNGTILHRIEFIDNGIGFDQQFAENIFSAFTRLNSKDRYEGTGLGLALCKKIVQRHHGSIEAVGEEGKGAKFVICLPESQPKPIL